MSLSRSSRTGAVLLFAASLLGLAVALYAYFAPLTGVTGSLGALGVIFACVALAILALVLATLKGRGVLYALRGLMLVGLIGTGVAGLLLHQWWIGAAMVVGLVGLIFDMARSTRADRPAHS